MPKPDPSGQTAPEPTAGATEATAGATEATAGAIEPLGPAVRRFIGQSGRYATLATINADGSPHQVVVWYLLRDDHIVLNSRVGRRWPTNLLRDARLSFTVEQDLDFVTLDGEAALADTGAQAQADIAEMARRYDPPDKADRQIAAFRTQQRISFHFRPRRAHTHGEIGGD